PALFQLLSHPKNNLLLCSPTGSGKTVMALCTAVQTLGDEQAVGFFTPQGHLVNQALRRCEAFLHPEAVRTANVSGETNDEERRIAYSSDDINFYVGTPQAVANDLKKQDRVPLSRMGRVFLDEVHEARGDHAFVSVIQTLRKHDLPLIGMTASPGRTLQEIEDRMHLLGATEYIAVFPPKHKVTGDPTRVHQLPEVREASKILEEGYREASKELHTLLVARGPAGIHMANEFAAMHRITQAEEDYRRSNPILYPPSEDGRVDSFTFPSMTKLKKLTDAISLEHDRHPHRTEMRSHWGTIRDHAAEIGHRLAMYNSLVLGGKFTFLNFAAKHFSHSRFPCPKNKLTFVKRCYRNTLEELQERAKQLGQGGRELEPLLKQLVVKHEGKTHLPAPHAVNRIYLRFESLARSHADADSRTWQRFFTLARELRHWYKLHESMSAGHHGSLDGMIDTVGRRAFLRRQGRIELKRNRDFALRAYKTTLEDLALSADQNPDSPLLTREHLEALGIQQSQPPTP
ncbi:MAG: DEAD/DEAH box helicase family protein, partial [Bdellovibrionales bacterium]|nr:DEAD/DEAH box helicase family protein [Bdellovibrionales bacterium]